MKLIALAAVVAALPRVATAQDRGVQFTPDGKRVLVNKDVGAERWAITLNENGSATGNVFRSDGGAPAFVYCAPLGTPNRFACFGADACTDGSGADRAIQGVPDKTRLLVQKDVGTERWAISLNFDDGTATGNIFRSDGGEPAFVVCTPTGAPNAFDCAGAAKCEGAPCSEPFTPIGTVTLPDSFFALPDPCRETYLQLGTVVLPVGFFEAATTIIVTFDFAASAPMQGFQVAVGFPAAKGRFTGAADNVACTSDSASIFTQNDKDNAGALILSIADASNLTFPIRVRCEFGAIGTVTASDFTVDVTEVTQNYSVGDVSVLRVNVTVQ